MKICLERKPDVTEFEGVHYSRCFLQTKKAFETGNITAVNESKSDAVKEERDDE